MTHSAPNQATPAPHSHDVAYSEVVSSALALNTRIAYDKGWNTFVRYCARSAVQPLAASPEDVADFFIALATQPRPNGHKPLSIGTLALYKSAITKKYQDAGQAPPTHSPKVAIVLKGLGRIRGTACRRVKALREDHIRSMLKACGPSPIGLRNAAIIAIGFAAALRRSEICGLKISDLEFVSAGAAAAPGSGTRAGNLILHIRKSKTDQAGRGQMIAVPEGRFIRPIQRLQAWLRASGITSGHVFQTMVRGGGLRGAPMHHSDIPRIVKHYAQAIGMDPAAVSGHSLRAGFVTSAAAHRARLDKIMAVTRHTDPSTVMKYIRDADHFTDHAGASFL